MIIVKKSQTNNIHPEPAVKIREYLMDEESMNGSLITINGRYPKEGFALNRKSKELAYIVSGSGKIVTEKNESEFSHGDTVFIDNKEKFYWEGNFTSFMVTSPKFNPNQHLIIK